MLNLYHHWREWDKDRSLNEYIQRFKSSEPNARASYITIFVNILLKLNAKDKPLNQKRIDQMMSLLMQPAYQGILDMYIKLLTKRYPSAHGENLKKIVEAYQKL